MHQKTSPAVKRVKCFFKRYKYRGFHKFFMHFIYSDHLSFSLITVIFYSLSKKKHSRISLRVFLLLQIIQQRQISKQFFKTTFSQNNCLIFFQMVFNFNDIHFHSLSFFIFFMNQNKTKLFYFYFSQTFVFHKLFFSLFFCGIFDCSRLYFFSFSLSLKFYFHITFSAF